MQSTRRLRGNAAFASAFRGLGARITHYESRFHISLTSLLRYLPTSSFTNNCKLTTVNCFFPARWTSSPLQAIIPFRRHRPGWRLSLRRGNEHFSERTEPAGVLSIRIHGYAAVDRRVV